MPVTPSPSHLLVADPMYPRLKDFLIGVTGLAYYADKDGDFFVVDRVKELIKYKGLQVAPAELEAVLLTHEAVADAAVFPQADAEAGEIPKAAVVLKPGKTITAEALMRYVQERVAPHKRVRALELVAQIPKSASGKILRKDLRVTT